MSDCRQSAVDPITQDAPAVPGFVAVHRPNSKQGRDWRQSSSRPTTQWPSMNEQAVPGRGECRPAEL